MWDAWTPPATEIGGKEESKAPSLVVNSPEEN